MQDRWGNPVSHGAACAVAALDEAITLLNSFQSDPVKTIDGALEEYPDFILGHLFKASLFATTVDRSHQHLVEQSVRAAEALADHANDRERSYLAAIRRWQQGDYEGATDAWGRIALEWPRDILAIQLAQLGDFYHGYSLMLRDRIARVMPHWNPNVPNYGFLLGMYAFGLEESGEYRRAEELGREAVERNSCDAWAVHAVAHVMEMEGRAEEGSAWLDSTGPGWAPASAFSYHNWWHKALFRLDLEDTDGALDLFDQRISGAGFGQALELVDGSSLLWRLKALGVDVGDRWAPLVKNWESRIDDRVYAFNDVHAAMAFAGAGREDLLDRLLVSIDKAAEQPGTNGMMSREIGRPGVRGMAAFGRGDYAAAVDHLLPVLPKANRFGGSHAQRDVFSWTVTEAATRAGQRRVAEGLVAERLSWKPDSPVNLNWAGRITSLID